MTEISIEIPKATKSQEYKALSNFTNLGLAKQRDIFIGTLQIISKSCLLKASLESWKYFQKQLKQLKFDSVQALHPNCIVRIQAKCLLYLLLWIDNGGLPGWCLVSSCKLIGN